ncbi:DNA-binding protein [Diplocloster hominis]|uniref:DNA-binding protein n=1 Tax=Diplocloster hominis TaxID=3079010 RepID=UPI0031B9BC4F
MEKTPVDKALLDINEVCTYLGIGKTKAREILTKTNNNFTVRIGNRLYANKVLLDKWLCSISGNKNDSQ